MVEQAIVNEWLSKADDDFSFAEANLHEGNSFYAQICFHFQQAAEKYLKAYILAKELPFERVHDLMHLLRTCAAHSDNLTTLREDCILLSAYYIETRYPVHWPTNYSQEVAEQAQMAAHNIAQAVRTELNFSAPQRPFSANQGFTLVELAIVLVIVGLLMGMGASMVGPLMTATKVRETRDNLDANSQAISSWASANNSIPNAAGFPTAAKSPQDSRGRPFTFLYYSSLARTSPTKDTICGRRSTPLIVQTNDPPNPPTTIKNVAFVILSSGDNTAPVVIQSTLNGIAITKSVFANGTISVNPQPDDKDIVRWVTLDELRSKVGCQGAPLKIVNNELPYGYASATLSYPDTIVAADGGTGSANYQWCIQNTTGTAPAGLMFRQNTPVGTILTTIFSQNCGTHPTWGSATQLVLNGPPTPSGSHYLTIFVRDSDSNSASKSFVLTINP